MQKLYGVQFGCIYEGGMMEIDLYTDWSEARELALRRVEKMKKKDDVNDDLEWKEVEPGQFTNELDIVEVIEFHLKNK